MYFPATEGGWYDFWSDKYIADKGWQDVSVSKNHIPVYVKAGSILPLAEGRPQTMKEAYAADWIVKVFVGADGSYTLYEDEGTNYNYEDEGTNYNYEKGLYSKVRFDWDDKKGELTIGEREGMFPGMIENRRIRLVKVSAVSSESHEISYTGKKIVVKL